MDLTEAYPEKFFSKRHTLAWRVPIVCDGILRVFRPRSVVDFGCAIGEFVKGFLDRGIYALGVEGSLGARPFFMAPENTIIEDLRYDIDLKRRFDVAMSLEVAEHIEEEFAEKFLENLARASDTVVMTAALPGQQGRWHVNMKLQGYWVEKMGGLKYGLSAKTAELRKEWVLGAKRKETRAYVQNLMVFEKGG